MKDKVHLVILETPAINTLGYELDINWQK